MYHVQLSTKYQVYRCTDKFKGVLTRGVLISLLTASMMMMTEGHTGAMATPDPPPDKAPSLTMTRTRALDTGVT